MSNRDDFTEKIKRDLCERVGGFCSNPSCGIPTIGPNTNDEKRTSIGVAAHISAASKGGPRYNPNLSPKERSGINNGIWLCANCATIIDSDEDAYPVSLILRWKADAECKQNNRLLNRGQENCASMTMNNLMVNNSFTVNNSYTVSDANTIGMLFYRILCKDIEEHFAVIQYAFSYFEMNFKGKYSKDTLQNEIDMHYVLYSDVLEDIYSRNNDLKIKLSNDIAVYAVDISSFLYSKIKEYLRCLDFSYESDNGIGFYNDYWSSYFMMLNNKYKDITALKKLIISTIRTEYSRKSVQKT